MYVEQFIPLSTKNADMEEVACCLESISTCQVIQIQQKAEFLSEARHALGRTALLLSGGAAFGCYHLGVLKALVELKLLPKIICGSSAGSFFAALVCTVAPEKLEELLNGFPKIPFKIMNTSPNVLESIQARISRFLKYGYMHNNKDGIKFIKSFVGDLTFQEAYDQTGFILNITAIDLTTHSEILFNYLTTPHILIWSAIVASCSLPYVFEPAQLYCKDHNGNISKYSINNYMFIDGSISSDLPMQRISELYNVNSFIVSQTEPHVVPLLSPGDNGGYFGNTSAKLYSMLKKVFKIEIKARVQQLLTLELIPTSLCKYLQTIQQDYRGTVTIWPNPSFKEYFKILDDPNEQQLQKCLQHGAMRAYGKIPFIKTIIGLEQTLEVHYEKLKADLNKYGYSLLSNELHQPIPYSPAIIIPRTSAFTAPRVDKLNEKKILEKISEKKKKKLQKENSVKSLILKATTTENGRAFNFSDL